MQNLRINPNDHNNRWRHTNKDIYLTYIELWNAFGSIDHAMLLTLIKYLDAVKIIENV